MKNTSLTTHHFSVILPPSSCHLSFVSSALLLSPRSLSGSLSPHCDGEEGQPPTWLWWEISNSSSTRGGEKSEDKRPNKVHLNIETAGPFFPSPYKEFLMNPGGRSPSLYRELITPSRIGNITVGAWKHTLTYTNTHRVTLFYEREREDSELSEFFLHERANPVGGTY